MRKFLQLGSMDAVKLVKEELGLNALRETCESYLLVCDNQELIPGDLGVEEFSDCNLREGDEVVVMSMMLEDERVVSIIYDHEFVYSIAVINEEGERELVKKLD